MTAERGCRATQQPPLPPGPVPRGVGESHDTSRIILITRPEPGASETAARIIALGLTPMVAPVLAIEPIPLFLTNPAALAGVLVTSGNALPALLPACRDRPILTVGDATAQRARTAGFARVLSAAGDATALAALVRQRLRPRTGRCCSPPGKVRARLWPLRCEATASG